MSAHWQTIRFHAAHARSSYAELSNTSPNSPIIDITALAEELYLLTAYEDPTLDPAINGRLDPFVETIRLNPHLSPLRRRFVLAHEIGHFVLHGTGGGIIDDDDSTINEHATGSEPLHGSNLITYNTRERYEQDANLFALELLVPAALLWNTIQTGHWNIQSLATLFGVSQDTIRAQLVNVCCIEPLEPPQKEADLTQTGPLRLDEEQQKAVDAPEPALIIAGPGTGKTRSIVGKYLSLIEQGSTPEEILALTFSNKAAEEMRQRIVTALSHSDDSLATRVEISTFHAWALNFLKSYGKQIGLPLNFRLFPTGDLFVLLQRHLTELPLNHYKTLWQPGQQLPELIRAISRCKDELCTPQKYQLYAEEESKQLRNAADEAYCGKSTQTAQKARDRAYRDAERLLEVGAFYEKFQQILEKEGILDYGDLIMRAVEAMRDPLIAAAVHQRFQHILVDEFQDINYASGIMVSLLDGGRGRVWAVGDPWQSIYRFRGASPANLTEFEHIYPGANQRSISTNYRSLQSILDASRAIMESDPLAPTRPRQRANRRGARQPIKCVEEWVVEQEWEEGSAIAHDILRRVRKRARALPNCLRHPSKRKQIRRRASHGTTRLRHFRDHAVLCRKHSHATRIVSVLEAHGIPVDWVGTIFDYPEVKDLLAICGLTTQDHGISLLRVLTIPEHSITDHELKKLVQLAHKNGLSLRRAASDTDLIRQLSNESQTTIQALHQLKDKLNKHKTIWELLTTYLFDHSQTMRERIRRASSHDYRARRELTTIGELLMSARAFINRAPDEAQDSTEFLKYIRLLIEAGEAPQARPVHAGTDAVRVMTAHAAKGLEFPIVYIPSLEEGQFPATGQGGPIPTLSSIIHGTSLDPLQDERYLLYVAMTRARDQLILTRTKQDNKRKRSSLLPGGTDGAETPWSIREIQLKTKCPALRQDTRLQRPALVRQPIPASSLETYERCPRRYLYQYGYQLYDDTSAYLRMHQAIRVITQRLIEARVNGVLPVTEHSIRDLAWHAFTELDLAAVPYSDDYFEEVLKHSYHTWATLRESSVSPTTLNQQYNLQLEPGTISLRVDQVNELNGTTQWIRTISGRERDDDHRDTKSALYALTYTATHQSPLHLTINYTSTGKQRPIELKEELLTRRREKLITLLTDIADDRWDPKPGFNCATCSYNLICPL